MTNISGYQKPQKKGMDEFKAFRRGPKILVIHSNTLFLRLKPQNGACSLLPFAMDWLGDSQPLSAGFGFRAAKPTGQLWAIIFYMSHVSAPSSLLKDTQGPVSEVAVLVFEDIHHLLSMSELREGCRGHREFFPLWMTSSSD